MVGHAFLFYLYCLRRDNLARDISKQTRKVGADQGDGDYNRESNQRSDETVFDRRHSTFGSGRKPSDISSEYIEHLSCLAF